VKSVAPERKIHESDLGKHRCRRVQRNHRRRGNHYFPPDSIDPACFAPSDTHTTCHWKGVASYYHVKVGGKLNADAAWFYPEPSTAANSIRNYIAFWRGVTVVE
jgi:uncharacterized protein (DUF427 family)